MKEATKRSIFRWIHIICSIPIIGYIYGAPSQVQQYAPRVRFIFLPIMIGSGLWMWKGHVVRRLISSMFGLGGAGLDVGTSGEAFMRKRT